MDVFARRLKELRNEHGMTQVDLGGLLHSSGAVISTYENGREPSYDILVNIAKIFGVSIDYLLGKSAVKHVDSGALMTSLAQSAAAAESFGVASVTIEELQALLQQLTIYLDGSQRVGTLPAKITTQLITGMTSMLTALNGSSAAAVIDANNDLLTTVLDVSNITTTYLNARKGSESV